MNSVLEVIFMNKYNQTDELCAILRTKICVRVLAIITLAAAAVLVCTTAPLIGNFNSNILSLIGD